MRSVVSTGYDKLGRVEYLSQPYELSGEPATGGVNGYLQPSWSTVWAYTKSYFDAAGRPSKTESKHLSTVEFDTEVSYDGWDTTLLDGAGNRTDQLGDGFGNVVLVEEYSSPTSVYATTYGYDKANRLTSVTDDSDNTTTIGYDLLGLKQTMSDPDTGSWEYDYNEAGELTRQQDGRGRQLFIEYDAWGRMTKKRKDTATTGTLVAEWFYDAAGYKGLLSSSKAYMNVGTVAAPVNGTVEVKYPSYDPQDRVTRQEWWIGKPDTTTPDLTDATWDKFAQTLAYNAAGSGWKVKYPAANDLTLGEEVTTGFSARTGESTTLTSSVGGEVYVDSATYTAWGAPLRQTFGGTAHDELRRSWVYDDLNRLFKVRAGKGALGIGDPPPGDVNLVHTHIYYDSAQNIREIVDWRNSDQVQCFTYDHRNRLTRGYTRAEITNNSQDCPTPHAPATGVGSGGYDKTFTYWENGNLKSQTGLGTYTYPAAGAARPHGVTKYGSGTSNTFSYDTSGNMTQRKIANVVQDMVYDYDSRLEQITKGSEITRFLYDADGGRVKQTVGTTTILYAGGLFEQTGSTATKWYRLGGGMVAFRQGTTLNYLIDDHLSSTSLTYTPATDASKKQLYYPFGDVRYTQTPPTSRGFTGQRRDGSSLMFYQTRYYDPQIGRFTQPDSIIPNPSNPQDFNRYSYVLNNPILYSDPSGLCPTNSDQAAACYAAAWVAAGNQVYGAFYQQPGHTVRALWNWQTRQTMYSLDGGSFMPPADFTSETERFIIANAFLWDPAHAKAIADADNPGGWLNWMSDLTRINEENISDHFINQNWTAFGIAYGIFFPVYTPTTAAAVARPDLANVSPKIQRQMQTRGWTPDLIDEAVTSGANYPAVNKLGGANTPATRYVSPTTGQSVVVDNATGEIIHVGGPGFKYDP